MTSKSYWSQDQINAQKRVNNAATSLEMPALFIDKFSNVKRDRLAKWFTRYLDAVIDELLPQLSRMSDGNVHVSTERLRDAASTFNVDGTRYSVWAMFKDIVPFFHIVTAGNNLSKQNSLAKVNGRMTKMLLTSTDPQRVYDSTYSAADLALPDVSWLALDLNNLARYIDDCEYRMAKAQSGPLYSKLERNLFQALTVQAIGRHTSATKGRALMPLIPQASVFGRVYYKGLSIQNVGREVRKAMLGHHYQYDVNAAVYAVKLVLLNSMVGGENELVGSPVGTYTREYLRDKKAIRERLARDCFEGVQGLTWDGKVRAIKDALTAIGFGARASGSFWVDRRGEMTGSALTSLIKDQGARDAFLADAWVRNFIDEQKAIEAEIVKYVRAQDDWPATEAAIMAARNTKRVTDPQVMAWGYQSMETALMQGVEAELRGKGVNVLARVHDAILTDLPVPARVMEEVLAELHLFSSLLSLDREEVREWRPVEQTRARDEADAVEAEHKRVMRQAEAEAVKYGQLRIIRGVA